MFARCASSRFRLLAALGALLCVAINAASAYEQSGPKWPFGTRVQMQLALGATSVSLQDGSGTWDNAAAAALAVWNQQLEGLQFDGVQTSGTTGYSADGVNTAFFSNTVYGESFGANTLAVTVWWTDSATDAIMQETDVLFNRATSFNSYRGPLQHSGTRYIYDFRRVAIHEFGHALGLAHPDDYGQTVTAIMNSIISDLDTVADDDVTGVKQLYGQFLNYEASYVAYVGRPFTATIGANFHPVSFTAEGLPPGLTIDSTGTITGTPPAHGQFDATVTAMGPFRATTAPLKFLVQPPVITSSSGLGTVNVGQSFRFRITASNSPNSFSVEGLPAGLTLDPATGLITGIPTQVGKFTVTLNAFSPTFESATLQSWLVVNPPAITVPAQPVRYVGGAVKIATQASSDASHFSATGLPSGLTIDPDTGVISGVATLSGTFKIKVTATTAYGTATGLIGLVIQAKYEHVLGESVRAMATDVARDRLYVATWDEAVVVYDCKTLRKIARLKGSAYVKDVSISADGTKLWAPDFTYGRIATIDLETLAVGPGLIAGGTSIDRVREGVGGFLYASDNDGIMQIKIATNAIRRFPYGFEFPPIIEISPDRRTLYTLSQVYSPTTLSRYDISGAAPVLIESVTIPGNARSLAVSHNGAYVIASTAASGSEKIDTAVRSASALGDVVGHLNPAPTSGSIAAAIFSSDDSKIFQSVPARAAIDIFDAATYERLGQLTLPPQAAAGMMVTDPSDSYLFEAGSMGLTYTPLKAAAAPPAPAHSVLNVSTRLVSGTGDNSLIAGFIVSGSTPKKVLLRAIGPSLMINGKMADPQIQLFDSSGKSIAVNDNWNYSRAAILATGAAPQNERDAAIVATLQPGSYTAVLTGVGNTTGVALVEMYDLDPGHSRIANISTRGRIGLGDNVMIGGFILGGDQATTVLVRAIGPSLRTSGISAALADTALELHDGNGAIAAQNDDWRSAQEQAIAATGAAPTDDRESAILATLPSGAYTAVVRGKNDTAGIGLVEVYNLTP